MKSVTLFNVFRDVKLVNTLANEIKNQVNTLREKPVRIMEFCGGHTHVIVKNGIDQLLEGYVSFVHGPGCPICVLAQRRVDLAIELAKKGVTLCVYGDMLRVPGSKRQSLIDVKAQGFDVRMVYSCLDVIDIALQNPSKKVVFFAIGFETTTPHTAYLILKARQMNIKNLYVVCNHVKTPPVIEYILGQGRAKVDAIIGPGHVSTVIGTRSYEYLVERFKKPIVISGFEPVDVLRATLAIVNQIRRGECRVENTYERAVTLEGNTKAQSLIEEVFKDREVFEFRGLGEVPKSAFEIREEYREYDGERVFDIELPFQREIKGCICGDILSGLKSPLDCKLFGDPCTPKNPIGSCMVSSEGACNAYYRYKNFGDILLTRHKSSKTLSKDAESLSS